MRVTHTYVELPVSVKTFFEIREALIEAEYHHAIHTEDGRETLDLHGIGLVISETEYEERLATIAHTLCKSGRFETGQGGCAARCLEKLGEARSPFCPYAMEVHKKLSMDILEATLGE